MSYRKVLEKPGFTDLPSGGSPDLPPASSFAGGDNSGPSSAGNAVADDGGDSGGSGFVQSLVSLDLDLGDVLSRAVQVGPLLDSDCQPCADGDSGGSVSTDVDAGLDTNGLAVAPLGLCLPDLSVLSLPVLSDLLAGAEYTGDHDDGTGSAVVDAACGCNSAAGSAGAEDCVSAQGDLNIAANLDLGGDISTDVLSVLLNGTPPLGDAAQSDGLLGGAILAGCGDAENSAGMSVDPELLPTLDGVLDGLVASTDLVHLFDCGDCST